MYTIYATFSEMMRCTVKTQPMNVNDIAQLARELVRILNEKQLKIAVAESLTGGLITAAITGVSGASKVFEGGLCSYSERVKATFFHVGPQLKKAGTAVDCKVALGMAEGVKKLMDSGIAIATTGLAGPEGDDIHPVGTVFIAATGPEGCQVKEFHFTGLDREGVRNEAVKAALQMALDVANGRTTK